MAQSPEDFLQTQQLLHKDSARGGMTGSYELLSSSFSLGSPPCVCHWNGVGRGQALLCRERLTSGCVIPAEAGSQLVRV